MKRKSESKFSVRLGDILTSTTVEQRAWIGAVALAYNDAEDALHSLAGACMQYVGSPLEVTARINGTDGLRAIIDVSVSELKLPSADLFDRALNQEGFAYLKNLRDAVVHARLLDSRTGVGSKPGSRGKRPEEVLLTPEPLEGLYKRLVLLKKELKELQTVLNCELADRLFKQTDTVDDKWRAINQRDIQNATSRCQRDQSQRLSLPPFPKFPAELAVELPSPNAMSAFIQQGGYWLRIERR